MIKIISFVLTNLGDSQSAWRTFSAIDGVGGEILWYRLLCPDKLRFLCEENEESEILNGYPYTFTGKKLLMTLFNYEVNQI